MGGEMAELDIDMAYLHDDLDDDEPEFRECDWCGEDENTCGCEVMFDD